MNVTMPWLGFGRATNYAEFQLSANPPHRETKQPEAVVVGNCSLGRKAHLIEYCSESHRHGAAVILKRSTRSTFTAIAITHIHIRMYPPEHKAIVRHLLGIV